MLSGSKLTEQSRGAGKPSHCEAPIAARTRSPLQHQLGCSASSALALYCCKQLPVCCLTPVPDYTASLPAGTHAAVVTGLSCNLALYIRTFDAAQTACCQCCQRRHVCFAFFLIRGSHELSHTSVGCSASVNMMGVTSCSLPCLRAVLPCSFRASAGGSSFTVAAGTFAACGFANRASNAAGLSRCRFRSFCCLASYGDHQIEQT